MRWCRRRSRARAASIVRRCGIRPASAGSKRRAPPIVEAQVEAEVLPFIDDMAKAYAWADLAVCRAGAMTVAELQAAGLGAIFVPLPDRHRRSPDQECRGHGGQRRGAHHPGTRSDAARRLSDMHRRAHARTAAACCRWRRRRAPRASSMPRHGWRICASPPERRHERARTPFTERPDAPHSAHSPGRHRRQRHGRHRRSAAQLGLRGAGLGPQGATP